MARLKWPASGEGRVVLRGGKPQTSWEGCLGLTLLLLLVGLVVLLVVDGAERWRQENLTGKTMASLHILPAPDGRAMCRNRLHTTRQPYGHSKPNSRRLSAFVGKRAQGLPFDPLAVSKQKRHGPLAQIAQPLHTSQAQGLLGFPFRLAGHLFIEFTQVFLDEPGGVEDRNLGDHGTLQASV